MKFIFTADAKWKDDDDRDVDSDNYINQEISADDNNEYLVRTQWSSEDHHRHYTSAMNDNITQREDGNALRIDTEPQRESSVDAKKEFADALNHIQHVQDAAEHEYENQSRLQDADTNPWIAQSSELQTGLTGDKNTTHGNENQVKGRPQIDPNVILGSEEGCSAQHMDRTSVQGGRDDDGRGRVESSDGESVVITIDSEQTKRQIVQQSKRKASPDKPPPVLYPFTH